MAGSGNNYKRDVKELLQRCEAVGWQVVMSGAGHFRVDTRRGVFTVASTPGGPQAMRNILQDAKRYGLEQLEAKLAERTEKARQDRIAADRAANDAKLAKIRGSYGADPFTVPKTEPDDAVDTDANLGEVDGVKIVAIAPALFRSPLMTVPGPLTDGQELLLADGRVLYRCLKLGSWRVSDKIDPNKPCHAVFPKVMSLKAHIGFHAKTAEEIEKAHRGPRGPYTKQKVDVMASPNGSTSTAATRELLVTTIEELAGSIFEIGGKLIETRNSLIKMADQVKNLQPEVVTVEPDPELVEKARKYDALRGLMQ